MTGGTVRLDASGNLTNIGTITSGLINGQTISSTANFTGTVAVASNTTVAGNLTVGSSAAAVAKLDVRGASVFNEGGTPAAAQATSAAEFRTAANSLVTIGESAAGNANPAITLYRTSAGANTGTASRIYNPNSSGSLLFQTGTNNAAYGSETYTTTLTLDSSGNVTNTGNLTVQGTGASSIAGTLAVTGAVTGGTYNLQTISSAANFTGTVAVATSIINTSHHHCLRRSHDQPHGQHDCEGFNLGDGHSSAGYSKLNWLNSLCPQ